MADAEAGLRGGEDGEAASVRAVPDVGGLHGFAGDRAIRPRRVEAAIPSAAAGAVKAARDFQEHGEDAGARVGFVRRCGEVGQRAAKLFERPR